MSMFSQQSSVGQLKSSILEVEDLGRIIFQNPNVKFRGGLRTDLAAQKCFKLSPVFSLQLKVSLTRQRAGRPAGQAEEEVEEVEVELGGKQDKDPNLFGLRRPGWRLSQWRRP